MRRSERAIRAAIFLSRWLVTPFLFGLILCLVLLIYRFFADFYELATRLQDLGWHDLVVDVLNLVDIALTANLVLIVVFSSYDNFIRNIEKEEHPSLPEGLTDVGFGALKQKLLGSIAVIAAVDALAWYLDLERTTDTSKLGWAVGFPLMFGLAMLVLAIADRLGRHNGSRPGQ
jgi:uncharacterized protein (TIGR00645 family)